VRITDWDVLKTGIRYFTECTNFSVFAKIQRVAFPIAIALTVSYGVQENPENSYVAFAVILLAGWFFSEISPLFVGACSFFRFRIVNKAKEVTLRIDLTEFSLELIRGAEQQSKAGIDQFQKVRITKSLIIFPDFISFPKSKITKAELQLLKECGNRSRILPPSLKPSSND
jgi:hypothetical protein